MLNTVERSGMRRADIGPLDLVKWTSLMTLTIVISVEGKRKPDWSKLRKENKERK